MDKFEIGWKVQHLYEGCILASIVHAIMVVKYPFLSHEHSWDGFNYSVQDSEGSRGTITFANGKCIGGFRVDSLIKETLDFKIVLEKASPLIQKLAYEETLQYMLEEVSGKVSPLITTIFWTEESGNIVSPHDFEQMIEKGGHLLEKQVMEPFEAFQSWRDNYEMNDGEFELMQKLFRKKINQPNNQIFLTKEDISLLGTDEEGLAESRESFNEINILWEV